MPWMRVSAKSSLREAGSKRDKRDERDEREYFCFVASVALVALVALGDEKPLQR